MRILFFSRYSYDNTSYAGGSWVLSLAKYLSTCASIQIGIAYPCSDKREIWSRDNIEFFPIRHRITTIRKILNKFIHRPDFIEEGKQVGRIVANFQPEIIELFGLETTAGGIVASIKDIPIVVHLQGIATPYAKKWFPKDYSIKECQSNSILIDKILRRTCVDQYKTFTKLATKEQELAKVYSYYFGRTEWDKKWCGILTDHSCYFHCDELIRDEFSKRDWEWSDAGVRISSVCNGELYKGFDNMLNAAWTLKERGLDFEWNVYGVEEDFHLKKIFERHEGKTFNECNIHFKGRKSAAELADILAGSSFYVHLSHVDNSPNALCEAMMVGTPCIAINTCGVPSMISNDIDGFLVDDYDMYSVADIIINSRCNRKSIEDIARAGKIRARERHNGKRIADDLIRTYSEIISYFAIDKR